MTKKQKTEKYDNKTNKKNILRAASDITEKRCFVASLISAIAVIILFAMMDDMTFTAYMWKISWIFIILGIAALGSAIYYKLKMKKASASEEKLLFTPSLLLYFSSLFTVWSVIFAFSAHRYIPIFIVINIAFIILYFIYLHFGKDFFSFSLYTAVSAGLIWIVRLFGAVQTGVIGISILVCSITVLALLAVSLIKNTNKDHVGSKKLPIMPFAISFAISAASLLLTLFVPGYEFYFITALMIWFIIFGIIKAVQIIEA